MMLYIHIPFCKRKCGYCDFLSYAGCENKIEPYVSALCKEIRLRCPVQKTDLTSIYLGGGTPSLLSPFQLEKIFNTINDVFFIDPQTEITMEVNPGTIHPTFAGDIENLPINRISMGLQSSDNEELRLLGRLHTFSDFLKSYETIAKSKINNINIDVMTGIPKQSLPSLEKTLRLVCGLRPSHISTYALTLEEATYFGRKYKKFASPLPNEEYEYKLYRLAIDYLKEHGYNRYEISNFCKDDYKSRHNMGYWERTPYLGVGLGASSFYNHTRLKNITNLDTYIKHFNEKNAAITPEFFSEVNKLSRYDEIEEFMYLGLRKTEGVLLSVFENTFGEPMDVYYRDVIDYLCNQKFLVKEFGRIYLTDLGIDVSNQVLSRFLFD